MSNYSIDIGPYIQCCGLQEASGISNFGTAERACIGILLCADEEELEIPEVSHLVFSQARRDSKRTGYGYNLAKYIIANGLGHVAASEPARNPNSYNHVTVFVWTLNVRGIERWYKKILKKRG